MSEQDLLPGNRVQRKRTQQWLPANGCAHPILLQEDSGWILFKYSITYKGQAINDICSRISLSSY